MAKYPDKLSTIKGLAENVIEMALNRRKIWHDLEARSEREWTDYCVQVELLAKQKDKNDTELRVIMSLIDAGLEELRQILYDYSTKIHGDSMNILPGFEDREVIWTLMGKAESASRTNVRHLIGSRGAIFEDKENMWFQIDFNLSKNMLEHLLTFVSDRLEYVKRLVKMYS